ncbi:adenylate/guanylate cyclase domain-containing protein [Geminicoccaceae bacterium 1502E]|nr:adenylate/guanylate cyclase domain-containing protein [Geminicoccaceae bacterium 1502E]
MRRVLRRVLLALLMGLAGAAFAVSDIGFDLEEKIGLGWLFRLRGPIPPPPGIGIVRLDRDSLRAFRDLPADPEAWPEPLRSCARREPLLRALPGASSLDRLPRAVHGCLVEELSARGAAVIAFDIAFRDHSDQAAGVRFLADAIAASGRVVLLEKASRQWLSTGNGGQVQADIVEMVHPLLAQAAAGTASFLLPKASERVYQFWTRHEALPTAMQLPARVLEVRAHPHRAKAGDDGRSASAEDARLVAAAERVRNGPAYYYANYYGPPGSFPTWSIDRLLTTPRDQGPDLRGHTIFVGLQELAVPQASDSFATVYGSELGIDLSGVEVAATAYANLLHDQTLRALPEGQRALLTGLLGTLLALAACGSTLWRGMTLALSCGVAYGAASIALFAVHRLWLPMFVPLGLLLPGSLLLGFLVHYLGAAHWLGVYVPRPVSQRLLHGRERATAEPRTREVTVMFTDIAGFTSFAARRAPEEVTSFVNEHFTLMTGLVEAEGGTLAQFAGDSVMAFWGAPDRQPDHAARACRAALAMARALEEENALRALAGEEPVRIRVGINTGMVIAGNVGAPGRSHYGLVGDTVNATQRIEQLGKTVCTDRPTAAILVSDSTQRKAGAEFRFLDVGSHPLRGRAGTERIFRLLGARTDSSETLS